MLMRWCFNGRFIKPCKRRKCSSRPPATPSATALQRIYWKAARTSAPCRSFWGTRTFRPLKSTRMFSTGPVSPSAARWTFES